MEADPSNPSDPYWQNPVIAARYTNFTSYKNLRNGAIALDIGYIVFDSFKVADNILAGIEVEITNKINDGYAQVYNSLIIGYSDNAEDLTMRSPSKGVIGPRTENFSVFNSRFNNFDKGGKAALGTCSHCFSPQTTDSGGRTLTVSQLSFNKTTQRVRYPDPMREIIYDIDGSLTGLGPKSWATSYWKHND